MKLTIAIIFACLISACSRTDDSQSDVVSPNEKIGEYAQVKLEQRMLEDPLDHLPEKVEILTHFGERADISPDKESIAFMAKSFGDAMVIDLKTRVIRCLTCNVPGAAFLRVMHLPTGDYIFDRT